MSSPAVEKTVPFTVRLDESLWKKLKMLAARSSSAGNPVTMRDIIVAAVEERVGKAR